MGIDRFSNFISKVVNCDSIEEVCVQTNLRQIASNCIIFDANFLIYQEIIEIENDVNDIIKIILCYPFSNNHVLLENYLKKIFLQQHWLKYDYQKLFDNFSNNEEDVINYFITDITNKNNTKLSIIELIIHEKILNKIVYLMDKFHKNTFIQSIVIFFDGIPSYSKIIEQRKRRIKTHLESIERKKIYKIYFNELDTNNKKLIDNINKKYNIDNADLYFDYIKWTKYRFTTNKSIGTSCVFITSLEDFINLKLSNLFPKCTIQINKSTENGESDLKIFKFIALNETIYDYSIHTVDSDLIHQILVQQTFYKIINKNINLCLIKYIKKNNLDEFAQIIEAPILIKYLLELYNTINNIKTCNYKIIWDLCIIFYFFGNDRIPSSKEIGPELGLDFFLISHYKALNNTFIVNFKKSCINFDLNNFKLLLQQINKTKQQNITKIILHRFFQVSNQFIVLFVDKLCLNFEEIKEFLKKFIINRGLNLSKNEINNMDESDMRILMCCNIENSESYIDFSIFNLNKYDTKLLIDSIKLIEDNINYYDNTFNGLIIYVKQSYITNDSYQDLYNLINNKVITTLSEKYPLFYDYNNINLHLDNNNIYNTNDYLKEIYYLIMTQFGNMKEYHSNNITYYKYYNLPSLDNIIDFINKLNSNITQSNIWFKNIQNENVDKYLDADNHLVLITPFLLCYNTNNDFYKKIIPIDNLWVCDDNINDFDYKKINYNDFMNTWSRALNNK